MISVERSFLEKFPRLAQGRARAFSQPVIELLRRIACEERINRMLAEIAPLTGFDFIERVLDYLHVSYSVANTDRENIPVDGRVVIVANHPLGALDAMALLQLVGSVRRDVRILANDVLLQFGQFDNLLLPVNVFGAEAGSSGRLREAYRALDREQALIVFPAGEVSRMGAQGVRDAAWSTGFVRLACKMRAPVLPVHIAASNSPVFYGASLLAKPLATLLLAREVFGAARARIGFSLGATVSASELERRGLPSAQVAQHMRRHVYRLPKRRPAKFVTENAIAHPESPLAVKRALARGEVLGQTSDGKRILLIDAAPDCAVMREIGRLRELSFRRVGEGTGMRRDLDRYDGHYKHLVLWDEHALAIVGAYRLGEVARIVQRHGMSGLYSASLFEYSPHAQEFLADGVELGRSFVQPAYWGSRSLDYLWQGIGAYLRHRPQLRYLFGPVSLSAALSLSAREWIVHCHQHYFGDPELLARARNPFQISTEVVQEATPMWREFDSKAGLQALKHRLAHGDSTLPVLYRQYVDLCEPDGVRFLAFGVDPAFGHCVDGLIRLDLARLKPAKRLRYLGSAQ